MRTKKSIYNVIATISLYIIQTLMAFVLRRVFLTAFGLDYAGLESVFANILSLLSLAELGIGPAITYRLYKPLAEGDQREVALLMGAYKQFYRIVALVISCVGLFLSVCLPYIVPDAPVHGEQLYICFFLYLLQTSASYLLAYKRSLLLADQEQYVTVMVDIVFNILQFVARLLVLLFTQNYILYLIVGIVRAVTGNIVVSLICDRNYPFLKKKEYYKKSDIKSKMKEMSLDIWYIIYHKIGHYVYYSTDGIVISAFLGVAKAGLLGNYNLIVGVVNNLFIQCSSAIQASVGNFVTLAKEDKESVQRLLTKMNYLYYSILSVCAICLFCLLSPFVRLWLGEDYLISQSVVLVICINLFIYCFYQPIANLYIVTGLLKEDKITSSVAAIVNLAVSVMTVKQFGLIGVYIGTILGSLVYVVGRTRIVFREYFCRSSKPYFYQLIKYFVITCGECAVTALFVGTVECNGIGAFIVCALFSVVVPTGINIAIFYKTTEFKYARDILVKIIRKVWRQYDATD